MVNAEPSFLSLPPRAAKPRRSGITHVLDKGMPVSEVAALLEVCGAFVDVWKLGWGTAYLDRGLPAKLALLDEHDVLPCTGGTLLEIAWHQGVTDRFLDWAQQCGFPCVEVSSGVVPMTEHERGALISSAADRFTVICEVGSKDPNVEVSAPQWAKDAAAALAAGARWVVTEGRESGTVGLYDPDGRVREHVVDEVVEAVGIEPLVFEAPRKDQQSWLIRRFGADVGLGNIPVAEVLPLEALRLGLRADTFDPSAGGRA
jgi:phosphosulfolactate synthase